MRFRVVCLALLLAAVAALPAHAKSSYRTAFRTQYNTAYAVTGSRIDACTLCHIDTVDYVRNSYGAAYENAGHSFTAIESADSDGDGYTNLQEIAAKTFPGNGSDFPAPTTGSLTVTILPAGAAAAGGQWRVGTNPYQNSGATVTGLAAGSVNVNFKPITGWTTPADQSPIITAGGTTSASGTYVQLALVPNVVGLAQAAASTAITGAGLAVGAIAQAFSPSVPVGTVMSQLLTAGNYVAPGTAMGFTVSKGPEPVTVPNVVGQTQAAASTQIVAANLVVGTITQAYSNTVPAGTVINQTPLAGDSVAPGTAVLLTVSKGVQPVVTGSILINKGAYSTNNARVALFITWSSNAVRMRFSDNGSTWTAWESVHPNKAYTLPAGDGYKTVRVQFMDIANNRSVTYSDHILVDTTLPTGSIVINDGTRTTASLAVTLNLSYADTGSGIRSMRFSNDGATWSAWEPVAAGKAWVLSGPAGYNTVRVQYRDAAGNYSAVYNDYILYQPI